METESILVLAFFGLFSIWIALSPFIRWAGFLSDSMKAARKRSILWPILGYGTLGVFWYLMIAAATDHIEAPGGFLLFGLLAGSVLAMCGFQHDVPEN